MVFGAYQEFNSLVRQFVNLEEMLGIKAVEKNEEKNHFQCTFTYGSRVSR
jgi:hypothetical protein